MRTAVVDASDTTAGQGATPTDEGSALSITCPPEVTASTVFDCTIGVTVPASAPEWPLVASVHLPRSVFHVAHDRAGALDVESRTVDFTVDPRPGSRQAFTVSLIGGPPDAGLSRDIEVSMLLPSRVGPNQVAHTTVRVARSQRVDLGFVTLPFSSLVLFTVLVGVTLSTLTGVWLWRRVQRTRAASGLSRRSPSRHVDTVTWHTALMLASALALFAMLPGGVETVRSYTSFTASACTLLDRGPDGTSVEQSDPMAAVRYTVNGVDRVSMGYNLRGTMYFDGSASHFNTLVAGEQYPCWYDPGQPLRVVLRRGITGGALLLLVFAVVLYRRARALLGALNTT